MSLEIVLLPLAFAAFSAAQAAAAKRDTTPPLERPEAEKAVLQDDTVKARPVLPVQTRMRDDNLLAGALQDLGANVDRSSGRLIGRWQGLDVEFLRDGQGVLQANFTGDIDLRRGTDIINAVDAAYGRQVQRAVLERLRSRAGAAGMEVASEQREDDDSVTIVLEVGVAR